MEETLFKRATCLVEFAIKYFFVKDASMTPTVCQEGQSVGIILYHITIILYYIILYHVILRRRARSEEV